MLGRGGIESRAHRIWFRCSIAAVFVSSVLGIRRADGPFDHGTEAHYGLGPELLTVAFRK